MDCNYLIAMEGFFQVALYPLGRIVDLFELIDLCSNEKNETLSLRFTNNDREIYLFELEKLILKSKNIKDEELSVIDAIFNVIGGIKNDSGFNRLNNNT